MRSVDKTYLNYQIALQEKNYSKAKEYFTLFKRHKLKEGIGKRTRAKLFFEEAQLNYLQGKIEKSKRNLNDALQGLLIKPRNYEEIKEEVLFPEALFIDIFDLYAVLEEDPQLVLRNYNCSFYVAKLLESNITSNESKIIHQYAKRNRAEKSIEVLLRLHKETSKISYLEQAFFYAEKGKSEILETQKLRNKLLKKHTSDSLLIAS